MEIISQFNKNSIEIVKVVIEEFNGKLYVDMRIWFLMKPSEPGSEIPTKKGICLPYDLVPKLIKALQEAQARL